MMADGWLVRGERRGIGCHRKDVRTAPYIRPVDHEHTRGAPAEAQAEQSKEQSTKQLDTPTDSAADERSLLNADLQV